MIIINKKNDFPSVSREPSQLRLSLKACRSIRESIEVNI